MRRVLGAVGAALLLAAGCDWSGNFLAVLPCKPCSQWGKPQGDRVVAAHLEEVSQSTQDSLKRLGLEAVVTQQGRDDVRIASTSKTGAHFCFVLHRVKTSSGESTRVHLEWKKAEDAKNHPSIMQVLGDLELTRGKGRG